MRAPLLACLFFLALRPFAAAANTPDALAAIERNARNAHSDAVYIESGRGVLLQIAPAAGEDRIHLMSATKSVVALAIGLLLDDGKLASIDEPVSTVYPEWRQGRKRDITIRMLMDHTSGLQNVANAGWNWRARRIW
ncbi:Putative penicillin-binding protein/beta-lactamase (fragment) [Stenotrophomonas indicatrix]